MAKTNKSERHMLHIWQGETFKSLFGCFPGGSTGRYKLEPHPFPELLHLSKNMSNDMQE